MIKKGKTIEFGSIEDVIDFTNGKLSLEETQRRLAENKVNKPDTKRGYTVVTKVDDKNKTVTFSS